MLEVELKSRELKEFIYLELGKDRSEPIYDTDLNKIKELQLDTIDFLGEKTDITLCDLVFFKNLESCYLINMNFSDNDIEILNQMNNIQFLHLIDCNFNSNKKLLLNIKSLIIDECENVNILNYNDITALEKLRIVNCKNVNIKGISKLSNVTELFLQNLNIKEINEVNDMKSLKYLNLNGSNNLKDITRLSQKNGLEVEHKRVNVLYDEEF